jgi:hypothetical protein
VHTSLLGGWSADGGQLLLCEIQILPSAARCAVRCETPGPLPLSVLLVCC